MVITEQTEEIASHGPGARPHHLASAARRPRWSPRIRRRWSSAASCRTAPSSPCRKVPDPRRHPAAGPPLPRDHAQEDEDQPAALPHPLHHPGPERLPPHLRAEDEGAAAVRGAVLRPGAGLRRRHRLQPQAGPAGADEPGRHPRGDEGRERRPGPARRAADPVSRSGAPARSRRHAADSGHAPVGQPSRPPRPPPAPRRRRTRPAAPGPVRRPPAARQRSRPPPASEPH